MSRKPKIIVIDDDPTGSQTVHSCLLLMRWDVSTLCLGLRDTAPIFFILTNTRALPPEAANAVTKEVCQNLKLALNTEAIEDFLVVSRSDSTLRGHYPIETDVIAQELGNFDAHFLVPAFFEGGRITRDSVHYLIIDGVPTPVSETEFAKDSVFGYRYSYLPKYVEEKTNGCIPEKSIERFLLADIRSDSQARLMKLTNNQCCVVDGEIQKDLDMFARDVLATASRGKKFLFRSAASILTALAALPPQKIAAEKMAVYVRQGSTGVIIVGSYVRNTNQQLEKLLQAEGLCGIEVDVSKLLNGENILKDLIELTLAMVYQAHAEGKTSVIYTSRRELTFPGVEARLEFGSQVSNVLTKIVRRLPHDIGFLISKGGITSNDILSKGLDLTSVQLLGQILAGCSVVITPDDHSTFPNLPIVLFPGNVGSSDALASVYQQLIKH
ncbi:four-carbon acid sugar kinase family protein [Richelia intracellularis]|nr:four-carbon acid sugar kinase family protein [Richelia intracellularis]